jgi:Transposase DDE domain
MSADRGLYQVVRERIEEAVSGQGVRITTVRRLALLVTGLVAAKSSALGQLASGLWETGVSEAQVPSIERRLRRTLNDKQVTATACYAPAVRTMIAWTALIDTQRPAILALDESSQEERAHLLRMSLTYWGMAVPLAWSMWPQNVAMEAGEYWRRMDAVLDEVAALLPAGLAVVVTADRAFDIAPFVDRIAARGWHWVVRLKAEGAHRFRDYLGRDHALRALVHRYLPAPGRRWKARGQLFKGAGWRDASVVATWAPGAKERLVVLTDLPPTWEPLRQYDRRFWIEPGFRSDKSKGWQWEACRVADRDRLERLLVAMAWATLLILCLGLLEARTRLQAVSQPTGSAASPRPARSPAKPQPARHSLFTLGLRLARRWLARSTAPPVRWRLTHLSAPSWNARWRQVQAYSFVFPQTVRL